MKCLVSLNSQKLVKEFVLKEDLWRDRLTSVLVWDGQEIPYERVVKLRMEVLPIVLRDENTFREIAGDFGKVIELFEFTWEPFDVSAGTCLILHGSGSGDLGVKEPWMVDLEDSKFQPVGVPDTVATSDFLVPQLPVNIGDRGSATFTTWEPKVGAWGSQFHMFLSYPTKHVCWTSSGSS
ncbi:hypothetical protein L1987_30354 [Smallanthus sonchifolius]|uniref:Uncharacterized protein n=1 Tax=Smallanthus sonchifolius TaxID=185202 RepID=A0ACB9I1Z4_9ASTR|nr:hypothetical protein L1987_30354 [Smallanthus sonchifolius]